ncbi:hypothetical protein D3OALGB2SA_236 [Olavius algarvensis associated proteobacterium Delta 3]|nr:hypothetical protein D3OALGB2SA_236 [Olavius algarvensis associated proteobacterium Delta 3]
MPGVREKVFSLRTPGSSEWILGSLTGDDIYRTKCDRNLLLRKIWFIDAQANCYFFLDGKMFVF